MADWVTAAPGGHGAVREVTDKLVRARAPSEGGLSPSL